MTEEENESASWPQETIVVTEENIEEIVNKYPIVIVDCWAPWCGPCQMIGPVIEELAKDYRGKVVFGKLNVDENEATASYYEVMGIPTLLFFEDGLLIDQQSGAMSKEILEPLVKGILI